MLKKLFGGRGSKRTSGPLQPGDTAATERYEGYELLARPIREGGVWRVAGTVRSGEGESAEDQDFVRADTMADHDEAVQMSLLKARQLVDERGRGHPPRG
ncbi:MAG: HlyU family transcriptional regulator [Halofilum sp. (in: g-proteobacteria)]